MNLEKKFVTFITCVLVLVIVPYCIYMVYINNQDDMYRSLVEFDSYTTLDKNYQISIKKFASVSGGEEVYHFKVYAIDLKENDIKFVKNVSISAYGTEVEYKEDKSGSKYDVNVNISSSSGNERFTIDLNEMKIKGQKIRAVF